MGFWVKDQRESGPQGSQLSGNSMIFSGHKTHYKLLFSFYRLIAVIKNNSLPIFIWDGGGHLSIHPLFYIHPSPPGVQPVWQRLYLLSFYLKRTEEDALQEKMQP